MILNNVYDDPKGSIPGVGAKGLAEALAPFILVLSFVFCFASSAKTEQGLAGWWKVDEGKGDIVHDSSGYGDDGKIYGAKWVKDKTGFGLLFDGKDDYVDCFNTVNTQLNDSLTISTWVNISETSAKSQNSDYWYVISRHDWNIGIDKSLVPFFEIWSSASFSVHDNIKRIKLIADRKIPTDKWIHLVAVYRLENETMEFYIDGEIAGFQKRPDSIISGHFRWPLLFGKDSLELHHFKGLIGETKIYNRALSLDEIKRNYQKVEIKSTPVDKKKQLVDLNLKKLSRDVKVREQFKWLGSKEGISEEVLAPWTPIEVEKQKESKGLIIKVWGRTYRFDNSPFPTSIETKGNSILAKPIKIIAKVSGKNVPLEWKPSKIERQIPGIISFTQDGTGGGLNLSAVTQIEYDGMIRMDWKITPQRPLKLEELTFEIPMSTKHAKYLYRSGFLVRNGFIPKDIFTTSFEPMIWLGDEEVGLEWFCESDKDWYNVNLTRCIEILPKSDIVMLRLHLVDKVLHLKPGVRVHHESGIPIMQSPDEVVELSYTFGLQATPVKPVIKDVWDYKIEHLGEGTMGTGRTRGSADRYNVPESTLDSLAKAGVKTIAMHQHWTDIYGATTTTYDETLKPIYDNALKKLVKDCHTRGIQFILYMGFMISDLEPAWPIFNEECLMMPPIVWGFPDYTPTPPHKPAHVCWRSVWQDYIAYGLDKMMDEYDIDGVYLDSTPIIWGGCKNTLHGCGYIWLDGQVKKTYAIFSSRQIMKRIYTVVKKHKPDGQVNYHNSSEMLIPAMSFATSCWNGEHLGLTALSLRGLSKESPILEQFPLDYFRTEFMGHQWGVPAEFLQGYILPNSPVTIGVALLHDVLVRGTSSSLLWKLSDKFGRKESEWLPYWKNKDYVTVNPEGKDVYVSLYRHPKNGVLAVVANLGEVETNVKVQFNLQNLKLKGQLSASDEIPDLLTGNVEPKPINISDGAFEVKLYSGGWKVIWIKET